MLLSSLLGDRSHTQQVPHSVNLPALSVVRLTPTVFLGSNLDQPLPFCTPAPPPCLMAPVPRPTTGLLRTGSQTGYLSADDEPSRMAGPRPPFQVLAPSPTHLHQRPQKQQLNRPRPRLLRTRSPSWGRYKWAATQ